MGQDDDHGGREDEQDVRADDEDGAEHFDEHNDDPTTDDPDDGRDLDADDGAPAAPGADDVSAASDRDDLRLIRLHRYEDLLAVHAGTVEIRSLRRLMRMLSTARHGYLYETAALEVKGRVLYRLLKDLERGRHDHGRNVFSHGRNKMIVWECNRYLRGMGGGRTSAIPGDPGVPSGSGGTNDPVARTDRPVRPTEVSLEKLGEMGYEPSVTDPGSDDDVVGDLLERLPPRDAQVARLRWRDDYRPAEIAEMLGIERNAVDQALFRARALIKRWLSE